jgi:hypothetical protein
MTVIASNLSNLPRTHQRDDQGDEQPGQDRVTRILQAAAWRGSKPLGPQQRVGEIEEKAERDEAGERIVEDHRLLPLQPFAGIGVADRRGEEGEAEGRHKDVQHGDAPMRDVSGTAMCGIPLSDRVRSGTRRIGFREGGYGRIIGIS